MENSQGPTPNPRLPADNPRGHQWGAGRSNGYALCDWCGCRENTTKSTVRCPEACLMNGEWYRRKKWLSPGEED